MRCTGITIKITLAASAHAGARAREQVCLMPARTVLAQDVKP